MGGQAVQAPNGGAISDTLTSVFRQRIYNRSIPDSLWHRALHWLGHQIGNAVAFIARTPGHRWIFFGAALCFIGAVIVNIITSYVGSAPGAARLNGRRRGDVSGDPWALAQHLAAAGNYTDAAHALYQGLLLALARRDHVRLHESKTVGDYARELRSRSSQRFAPFRDFARTYEVVVYGLGTCDRDRYDRLQRLAEAITGTPQHA